MDLAKYLLQQRQKEEEKQNILNVTFPAKCHICGLSSSLLYAETKEDTWTMYRQAYEKAYRRRLCSKCVTLYKPSLCHLLEKRDRTAIRALPLFDKDHKLLPGLIRAIIECHPEYYPAHFLFSKKVHGTLTDVTKALDCTILKIIPDWCGDSTIDYYREQFGYMYTCVNLFHEINPPYMLCGICFCLESTPWNGLSSKIEYD